jgi:TM2 domain-containing membrane protein YozV
MKSKTTAALLAFFLGGFGIHQFYLGNTGKGVAYLLFFWTLIPSIIAFIDFIILLTKSDDDFNAKYNRSLVMVPQYQ